MAIDVGELDLLRELRRDVKEFQDRQPGSLFVGSLGRSAYTSLILNDPTYEYGLRGEHPFIDSSGQKRDLDVITPEELRCDPNSFARRLDTYAYRRPELTITQSAGDWYVISETFGVERRLDEEVMRPFEMIALGGAIVTVPRLQTLGALAGVPRLRPKDTLARKMLHDLTPGCDQDVLPVELYSAFDHLRDIESRGAYGTMLRAYNALVPRDLRLLMRPGVSKIKRVAARLS